MPQCADAQSVDLRPLAHLDAESKSQHHYQRACSHDLMLHL